MAVIWQKITGNTRYEVRSAGRTRRLYTNGVFHSQYHPGRALSGGIWDLLMLPAFLMEPGKLKRVLVLGVGGGAVIKLLQASFADSQITAVDLDPVHLQIATEHFGVSPATVSLHCADARQWVKDYRGAAFDMIIEDLFTDINGEPERALAATSGWINQLLRHLNREGMLVMNFIGRQSFTGSGYFTNKRTRSRFRSVYSLQLQQYENLIVALSRKPVSAWTLRSNLNRDPGLGAAIRRGLLPYRISKIA